ncbi:MAG: hypothetical protein N2170_02060 [Bacteroidia bacterium]|nr:hypothetical protein [Bacteroidia bacterium]
MRNRRWMAAALLGLFLFVFLLEACAPTRTSRGASFWQRSGSCPATRTDNHVYY